VTKRDSAATQTPGDRETIEVSPITNAPVISLMEEHQSHGELLCCFQRLKVHGTYPTSATMVRHENAVPLAYPHAAQQRARS